MGVGEAEENGQLEETSGEPVGPSARAFAIYDTVNDDKPALTLHEMAERGLANEIMRLVERRLDVNMNEKDRFGRTPLHWAAELGHVEAVEVLVDLGADLRVLENMGRTPIHLAARSGHVDALESALDHLEGKEREAIVNMQDHRGVTALFLASQKGQDGLDAFKYLMQCGALYNQQQPPVKSPQQAEG